jgi:hypothetical protein
MHASHAYSQSTLPTWHQVLNGYVDFLSHAADAADDRPASGPVLLRIGPVLPHQPGFGLRLVPTRTLSDYYYQTARKDNGRLAAAEIATLGGGRTGVGRPSTPSTKRAGNWKRTCGWKTTNTTGSAVRTP